MLDILRATPTQTQTWNGTAWTHMVSPGAFTIDMYAVAVFGTQTSAIKSGGLPPGTNTTPNMQSADEWNGSTWTATTSKSVANGVRKWNRNCSVRTSFWGI